MVNVAGGCAAAASSGWSALDTSGYLLPAGCSCCFVGSLAPGPNCWPIPRPTHAIAVA